MASPLWLKMSRTVGTVNCFFASVESDKIYKGIDLKCKSSDGVLDHAPMYDIHHREVMCSDNGCIDKHMVCEHVIGIGTVWPMAGDAVDDVECIVLENEGEGRLGAPDNDVEVSFMTSVMKVLLGYFGLVVLSPTIVYPSVSMCARTLENAYVS